MIEVSIKEARSQLSALLNKVNHGEEVVVTRHGRKVACLVPPGSIGRLPSLKHFRETIQASGKDLSQAVARNRSEERY